MESRSRNVSSLTLRQLEAVEQTIRSGSYSKAARVLGVSQPSVSNLVAAIERQFGCKLVHRENAALAPTPVYDEIRGRVIAALALIEETDRVLSQHRDLEAGSLRIGYSTYQVAMPVIARFIALHPNVDLVARSMASDDLVGLLQAGEIDLAYITARDVPNGIEGYPVADVRIGVVLREDHPLMGKQVLDWRDLRDEKIVTREPSSGTRTIFEDAAGAAGLDINTIFGLGSWGSVAAILRDGIGVGVALDIECREEKGLQFKPIDDPRLHARQYLISLPAMKHTASLKAFHGLHHVGTASGEGL